MTNHKRIWLEPAPGADEDYGRQWCQNCVWEGGVEYVRADLAEITTLRKELAEARAVTPEKIAAAWAAWHSRHGGKLGPGPAFVEAIEAALRPPSKAKGEKK